MGRSSSSLAVGHASKGAAKVRARSSLMSGLWLVERVDELGGRLRQRSASSQSEVALEVGYIPVSSPQRRPCCRMCGFANCRKAELSDTEQGKVQKQDTRERRVVRASEAGVMCECTSSDPASG